MDKSPKREAGQCQETTKVQGRKKKNSKFWNSLLLQLQWSRKWSLDRIEFFFFSNKLTVVLPPVGSPAERQLNPPSERSN